ncbi:MAG TPA: hypothetical protein ACFYD7_00060 [Candidatus Wujingus californicus]|uniref:hypothetical protein n=1 Tax=Candidatus Wujingus californicus TaxID=3367618 RepID=UPI001DF1EE4D|nr:hypothetical protein [Planctomycetota bacterium]MDO8094743.1 hypothetical protein [Candidatus Brocadiales bacterium]MDO8130567.1 hypothetical protein [Candidatus Brocadiales bacterium]
MSGPRAKVVFRTENLTVVRVREKTGNRVRTFVQQKAKLTLVKSKDGKVLDDLLGMLPAAAWRSKFAARIKAATLSVVDKIRKGTSGPLKKRLGELDDAERVRLVRAASRARLTSKGHIGAVNRADGLMRELDFWHELEPVTRTPRGKALDTELRNRVIDFNKGVPENEVWEESVQYFRRAYTPGSSPKGLPPGEVGDVIAATFSKKKKPPRVWLLMIGNAKGASNAVELSSKEGWFKPWSGEIVEGEFLGQPDFDLERIPEFGMEIPGVGTFKPDQIKVGPRSTLRIGVVPPDISQAVRNHLDNFAKYKSKAEFRIWESRIPSKESREASEKLVDLIEES